MSKFGKVIFTTLIVGLVCFAGIYYSPSIELKFTIGIAYGIFLIIYRMIITSPTTPTPTDTWVVDQEDHEYKKPEENK